MHGRVLKAAPNTGHYVLARLAIPSIRQKLAPGSELTHITQNVDGLCQKALNETVAAFDNLEQPAELIEMHGRLFDVVCTARHCKYRETNYKSPICEALSGTEKLVQNRGPEPVIRLANLPRCLDCGKLCRPGVVWFGERPHRMQEIFALADEADLCIIVGTSALVCLYKQSLADHNLMLSISASWHRFNRRRRLVSVLRNMGVRLLCSISSGPIILTGQIFSSLVHVRYGLRKYWECR